MRVETDMRSGSAIGDGLDNFWRQNREWENRRICLSTSGRGFADKIGVLPDNPATARLPTTSLAESGFKRLCDRDMPDIVLVVQRKAVHLANDDNVDGRITA